MLIATFIDRREVTKEVIYGFGPDGKVFVAIKEATGVTYKIFNARKVAMVDILNWPMVYGVVEQPVSPGSQLLFQTYNIWNDQLEQYHFLDGQADLEKRADALNTIADASPIYLKSAPKWARTYMPSLFDL